MDPNQFTADPAADNPPDPGLTADDARFTTGDDTGDVIDKTAHDPQPQEVLDPGDESYVEPAASAVPVNPARLLPTFNAPLPPAVGKAMEQTEAELTRRLREMTGRDDIRVVFETAPVTAAHTGPVVPSGTVGTSLPDRPDTTDDPERNPEGCA